MAKSNLNTLLTVLVIGLLVIGGMVGYGMYKQQALAPSTQVSETGGYISTGSTTVTVVGSDALNTATAVTGTTKVRVNGAGPYATDDFTLSYSPKDALDVLIVNGTSYHNALVSGYKVPTSPTDRLSVSLKKNATLSMTLFNTNNLVMDSGAASACATNQSASTGGAYNMKLRIDGQDKTSSNDMTCILEASDSSKADKMTLNGFGATYVGMSKPSSYTLIGATSSIWVYNVPAIEGAVSPEGVIGVTSKTGQDLSGVQFKITCLSKEHVLDSLTGLPIYEIEDSAGTSTSMLKIAKPYFFD